MSTQPETEYVTSHRVKCDGASQVRGGAALGHPRVWLEIDEKGYVDCGYCDKRFVFQGDPHAHGIHELGAGHLYSEQPVQG
jgi:uncharacterized Zn-finger protein